MAGYASRLCGLESRAAPSSDLPTKFSNPGGYGAEGGKMMGIGETIVSIAQVAYASPNENNWDSARTIVSPDVPQGRYDFIANLSSDSWIELQNEMKRKLGVAARRETRETEALALVVKHPNAPGLKPTTAQDPTHSSSYWADDGYSWTNGNLAGLALYLERTLNVPYVDKNVPVVDKTGLDGNYDLAVKWDKNDIQHDSLKKALLDQLGLNLSPQTCRLKCSWSKRQNNLCPFVFGVHGHTVDI